MASERMSEAEQMTLLMSLQREMVEMKRKNEEVTWKNEEEILALQKENEEMKRRFIEGGPFAVPTNLVGRSFTSPPDPKTDQGQGTHSKVLTQEMDGESHLNKSVRTTGTLDLVRLHPFTNSIIGVPLSDKWKYFNRDHYDDTTDPNEHMNAYTTHMSLYTSDDTVIC